MTSWKTVGAALIICASMAVAPAREQLAAADSTFLQHAARDGMAEIELAELAQSKASNGDVKALAAKIRNDHTNANEELKSLAAKKHVTLPSEPDQTQASAKDRFSKMDTSFDRNYVSAMVADHRKAIADFTAATKSADPDVKAFAEKTLPALKEHLQRAEALQKIVK